MLALKVDKVKEYSYQLPLVDKEKEYGFQLHVPLACTESGEREEIQL